MHHASHSSESLDRSSRRRRKSLALDRIAASRRQRITGPRSSTRLMVTGIVVALGAASFVVASAADIPPAPTLCSSSNATIRGTSRNNVIVGTPGNDVIWGGAGDDVISGMGGNDRLCGSDGNDRLYGGSGNDYLDGGAGTDVLRGDGGRSDTCVNGEQVSRCEFVGTTTPPTTAPPTTAATTTTTSVPTTAPPPPTGRFATLPVGATLPSEQQCAAAVRRMTENRPVNVTGNAVRGTAPNATYPRATGNFTGTTDEILQWTACKWGIDEDLVRAQVAIESWWNQTAGGDMTSTQSNCHPDVRTATGQCPESVGLMQVRYVYHAAAFVDANAIRSTAYNIDYAYAHWRACFEGQLTWLNTVERGAEYRSGDALGCTGVWFSGRWRTAPALQYIAALDEYMRTRIWTTTNFGPSTPVVPTSSTNTTLAPTTTLATTASVAATTTTGPPTTTVAATTTTGPPTTTAAPTTTVAATTTTRPPTTTVPAPSTTAPQGAAFVGTFDGNTGLNLFRTGTFHRDVDTQGNNGLGGSWQGDHNVAPPGADCGDPSTSRTLTKADRTSPFYVCREHLMSSVGHVDSYSIAWFSPNRSFNGQTRVSWEVNVTDLLARQWYEVMIVSANGPDATCIDWLPCDLPHYPADATVVGNGPSSGVRVWSDGGAETPTWEPMCGGTYALDPEGCASKAIRRQWSVEDNENGTLRVSFNGDSWLVPGSFPTGDWKVVFKSHNYTSDKDGSPVGHTWHWDNIIVS